MFIIKCPYCGDRDHSEFNYGGEAHIVRPKQPTELSDDQWAEYLFMRKNIKGLQYERWNHTHGCRRWFNMARDTSKSFLGVPLGFDKSYLILKLKLGVITLEKILAYSLIL